MSLSSTPTPSFVSQTSTSSTASISLPTESPTCPAKFRTNAFRGNTESDWRYEHITCYAPYLTGEAGTNISDLFEGCCNNTVVIVRDDSLNSRRDCYYFCNATSVPANKAHTGVSLWNVQHCMDEDPRNYYNNTYNVKCLPKLERSTGIAAAKVNLCGNLGLAIFLVIVTRLLWE